MRRLAISLLLGMVPVLCWADQGNFSLVIKDHKFQPVQLTIPANQRIILIVENQDPTVEEFESYDQNREKVVQGNGKIKVLLAGLCCTVILRSAGSKNSVK